MRGRCELLQHCYRRRREESRRHSGRVGRGDYELSFDVDHNMTRGPFGCMDDRSNYPEPQGQSASKIRRGLVTVSVRTWSAVIPRVANRGTIVSEKYVLRYESICR